MLTPRALGAAIGIAALIAAPLLAQAAPGDADEGDVSVMPESPVSFTDKPRCTDKNSCLALINLSHDAQVTGFYVAEKQRHGQIDWSGNLFVGEYALHPFHWTAWNKPPKMACKIGVKIQLRYQRQTIDVDPEEFNLCKRDAAGHAMIEEICVHYPPVEIPPGVDTCALPAELPRGTVTVLPAATTAGGTSDAPH